MEHIWPEWVDLMGVALRAELGSAAPGLPNELINLVANYAALGVQDCRAFMAAPIGSK